MLSSMHRGALRLEGKAIGSNNMDRALLSYAINHGYNDSDNDPEKVEEISGFDSEKKCATVKLKNGLVYWKGATEKILIPSASRMYPKQSILSACSTGTGSALRQPASSGSSW